MYYIAIHVFTVFHKCIVDYYEVHFKIMFLPTSLLEYELTRNVSSGRSENTLGEGLRKLAEALKNVYLQSESLVAEKDGGKQGLIIR